MRRLIITATLIAAAMPLPADNSVRRVENVTATVQLTDDVDMHVTSDKPFDTGGIVDIANTDHAVLILDKIKPSRAITMLAAHVKINGKKAVNNTNCQVKMYDRGAIILPYGTSTKPLTIYDEPDFGGESIASLTEGHNGNGYMKNLPAAWNNRIRSFRLKRGYMVTFALKLNGTGYSRCFIADKADLEMASLPDIMDARITSYRIFKWYDAGKKQLANAAGDKSALNLLNVQSSYDWGEGNASLLPDYEWVPNHIYEDWPSSSAIGKTTQSPHSKNNNEPQNKSDDHPQDLNTILANWEKMMSTGLRLCSPASWDGSDSWNATGFLAQFLDSIDARGWRCDIIDLHCYWPEGNFGNVSNWSNKYKRPIWISEWCWGASWNNNGSFSGNATEASFANAIKNITTTLNANNAVERYYYWNGENGNFPCKLIRNGQLTQAGKYYAEMTTGPGYNGYGNYVPKDWRLQTPALDGNFTASTAKMKLTWDNLNGDLANTITLERSTTEGWEVIAEFDGRENETRKSFTFTDDVNEAGTYKYRVREMTYARKYIVSNIVTLSLGSTAGTADFQNGNISAKPAETSICYFATPFDEQPVIVTGSPSNKNIGAGMVDNVLTANRIGEEYRYFQFRFNRWKSDASANARNNEEVNFLVLKPGRRQLGTLNYEADYTAENVGTEAVEIRFSQPFAEAPIVFATPVLATASAPACFWRVSDVTAEGFRLQLMQEKDVTTKLTPRPVAWVAIERGSAADGKGNLYTVADTELTFKSANPTAEFGTELIEPRLMAQLQTNNGQAAANLRIGTVTPTSAIVRLHTDKSDTARQPSSTNPVTERIGMIIISTDPNYDAITAPWADAANADDATIYDISGRRMTSATRPGIYIRGGRKHIVK
jgi:hypothetical protein